MEIQKPAKNENAGGFRLPQAPKHEIALQILQVHLREGTAPVPAKALQYLRTAAPHTEPLTFAALCEDLALALKIRGSPVWQDLYSWMTSKELPVSGATIREYYDKINPIYFLEARRTLKPNGLGAQIVDQLEASNIAGARRYADTFYEANPARNIPSEIAAETLKRHKSIYSSESAKVLSQAIIGNVGRNWPPSWLAAALAGSAISGQTEQFDKIAANMQCEWSGVNGELKRHLRKALEQIPPDNRSTLIHKTVQCPTLIESTVKFVENWSARLRLIISPSAGDRTLVRENEVSPEKAEERYLKMLVDGEIKLQTIPQDRTSEVLQKIALPIASKGDFKLMSALSDFYDSLPSKVRWTLPTIKHLERSYMHAVGVQRGIPELAHLQLDRDIRKSPGLAQDSRALMEIYRRLEKGGHSSIAERSDIIERSGLYRFPAFWSGLLAAAARRGDTDTTYWVLPLMERCEAPISPHHFHYVAHAFQRAEKFAAGCKFLGRYSDRFSNDVRVAYADLLRKNLEFGAAINECNRVISRKTSLDATTRAHTVRAQSAFHLQSPDFPAFLAAARDAVPAHSHHWYRLQCLRVFSNDKLLDPRSEEASITLQRFDDFLTGSKSGNTRLLADMKQAAELLRARMNDARK